MVIPPHRDYPGLDYHALQIIRLKRNPDYLLFLILDFSVPPRPGKCLLEQTL
jgi:hypothetical protein